MSEKAPPSSPVIYLLARSALDRRAYRLLLDRELGLQVAIESNFEPTAIWQAMRGRPTLAVVDADTPSSDARDAAGMIPRLCCDTRVVVLAADVNPLVIQGWGATPMAGYVVKDGGVDELRVAIRTVLAGEQYFSDGVRAAIAEGAVSRAPKLSRREAELLPLLARGMTLRDAAREMSVGYKTADSYRTSLLRKLGVRDRVELARYAIREKIVEP